MATWFHEEQWRRLAAPPLPPTVEAVLAQADAWADVGPEEGDDGLLDVVDKWRAAGRPGIGEDGKP
jgi:hypothetical protein